jgi:hypothetical protein
MFSIVGYLYVGKQEFSANSPESNEKFVDIHRISKYTKGTVEKLPHLFTFNFISMFDKGKLIER